jgi:hypothetical protein
VRGVLLALAATLVVGCASPSVPALRVTRYSTVSENRYPAFDRSVDDAAAARRLYDALRALPPAPGARSCPDGFGLRYRLTFNEAARVILLVVVEGDGCADVVFSEADRRATDAAFWDLLGSVLGVKRAEMLCLRPDGSAQSLRCYLP